VAMAVAKAAAEEAGRPLYAYLGGPNAHMLPTPMMNIINGGEHADNPIDFQEFMSMPVGAEYHRRRRAHGLGSLSPAEKRLRRRRSQHQCRRRGRLCTALGFVMSAIEAAGYKPGDDVAIALDPASTEFFKDGKYVLAGQGKTLDASGMIDLYEDLCARFPIVSIEDALSEDDWDGFKALTDRIGGKVQIVGDDLFVTNPARLREGIANKRANSILVKVNQIGTLTETLETGETAHKAGYPTVMSHRSGETEDSTIADLAVATNCGQIKTGSLSRSDRTAKYNQLIRIEEMLGACQPGIPDGQHSQDNPRDIYAF